MKRLVPTLRNNQVRRFLLFLYAGATALVAGLIGAGPLHAEAPSIDNAASSAPVMVLTHHFDQQRTGWNPSETVLTTANVNSSSFGLLRALPLDDQVDAQPLVAGGVVFVATENNTIYAIDAVSGNILLQTNLGPPVPQSVLPGACNSNGPNLGINSTPVIDPASQTMYVIAYTLENGAPVYRLHALDLSTLSDKVPSVVVTASGTLTDGTIYNFNAAVSRQRPALLAANGNIYAAFGSFCDLMANLTRGWVLGWQTGSLTPLPNNQLNNRLSAGSASGGSFLTSIWMSGAGIAVDETGNLFFVTSNSNSSTYDAPYNIQESLVKMSPDLTTILGLYTPTNQAALDAADGDFGSGGVLIVPEQTGLPQPHLAVTAGKSGQVYVLNRDAFAGLSSPSKVVQSFPLLGCFCASSYFLGSDIIGRIVTSLGQNVIVYKLQSNGSRVALVYDSMSVALSTDQSPGFFTTVSSNGTQAGTAIIWGVTRPTDSNPANVLLFAYDNQQAALIYSAPAGTWPTSTTNANIVPVVANGLVYVASYRQLAIFGLGGNPQGVTVGSTSGLSESEQAGLPESEQESRISGTVSSVTDSLITLQTRSGVARVDATQAQQADLSVPIVVGSAVIVRGTRDPIGLFHADAILHAKASPALWPPDR
jgi:hypothetical protein